MAWTTPTVPTNGFTQKLMCLKVPTVRCSYSAVVRDHLGRVLNHVAVSEVGRYLIGPERVAPLWSTSPALYAFYSRLFSPRPDPQSTLILANSFELWQFLGTVPTSAVV